MWIESHQELARHPKTKRLARMLEITVPAAIGHLHLLWWWALDYAQDGYLGNYTADDLADAMMWEGDPAILWEGLRSTHFLDDGEEGCEIHDWHQYGGRLAEKRKANIERVHRWRATKADVTHNECVRYTATEQNRTVHNSKSTGVAEAPSTPQKSSAPDPRIEEAFVYFREKIQPGAREFPKVKIKARLEKFSLDELKTGIDHFAATPWEMDNNAHRGADWFFQSNKRSEAYLNLQPRDRSSSNGHTPAEVREPALFVAPGRAL